MENQDNFIYDEEYAVDTVDIVETQEDVSIKETVEIIDVSEIEVFTIDTGEAFTALGEGNEQLKHTLLNGRELPDQHPIMAITGLRDELNAIESLKTVYSNNKNYANYYMWQDENPLQENREGFFVSLCPTTNKIKICDFNEDIGEVSEVFGITVNSAGFIGGQDDVARDIKYGLVVYSGIATVRCESNVSVGDYVMPNRYGIAEKAVCSVVNNTGTTIEVDGKCGYLVVALDDTSGTSCAEIIFNVSAKQLNDLENSIHKFNVRIDNTETNITSAINVANEAYYLASNLGDIGKLNTETIEKANDALEKAEQAFEETVSQSEQIAMAKKTSEEAKAIAQSISTSTEAIRNEAVSTANDALAKTNDLMDSLEPITTWADEDGNTGATYFVEYINDGVATKVDIEAVSTLTDELTLEVRKNARGLQTLVSHVDKYSLGEYSQAYGLTLQQAQSILDTGMIYVPTQDHFEQYEGSTYGERTFLKGYAYSWNAPRGQWKTITTSPCVAFSTEYIAGNDSSAQFWVVEESSVIYEDVTYNTKTLYMWQDGRWITVASLKDNANNRINSMLAQTTNSISAEITNARGSATTLGLRLTDTESELQTLTSWKSGVENDVATIATIKQTADAAGASIAQVVQSIGSDGVVNAASIVTAINDSGDSSIALSADYINIDGAFTTNGNAGFDTSGGLFAKSGKIANWEIRNGYLGSSDWSTYPVLISQTGTSAWVNPAGANKDCVFYSKGNFAVDNTGKLYASGVKISGEITATSGAIGGWNLRDYWEASLLYTKQNGYGTGMSGAYDSFTATSFPAFWAGYTGSYNHPYVAADSGEDWRSKTTFYVEHNGHLHATGATIQGTITATSGSFSDSVTIGGTTVTAGYLRDLYNYAVNGETVSGTTIQQIDATKGKIGGWTITDQVLKNTGYEYESTTVQSTIEIAPSALYVIRGTTQYVGLWHKIASNNASDARLKEDIKTLSSSYDTFFDLLQPKQYLLKSDYTGKYHMGFVAQEVLGAMEESGLDYQQIDALSLMSKGTENEYWTLDKQEFIALNTWQIQKLKKRVAELEAKFEQKEK